MERQRAVRALAWSHAITRTTLGALFLASPKAVGQSWLGDANSFDRGGEAVVMRAFAIRDFVIGLGTLAALRAGAPVKRWFQLGFAVEAAELAEMVRQQQRLGTHTNYWAALTAMGAVGGALIGLTIEDKK